MSWRVMACSCQLTQGCELKEQCWQPQACSRVPSNVCAPAGHAAAGLPSAATAGVFSNRPQPPCAPPFAQVIRYSHNGKSKGYGFVSFGDQIEGVRVIKEMNGKYVGEHHSHVCTVGWKRSGMRAFGFDEKERVGV